VAVVLVLRARGLGDLLAAVPALRALRRARPHDHLVLAAPYRLKPIVDLIAAVDEMIPASEVADLRWDRGAPELAVNLQGHSADAIAELIATDAQHILTFRNPAFPELRGPAWQPELHEVDRWCHLLESAGIGADSRNLGLMPPVTTSSHRDCVVVHIGAGALARRWPPERFAAVVRHLLVQGREVVLTGDEYERETALAVAARAGLPVRQVLAGQQNLLEVAATMAEAALVVCGDTGPAALATAFGTRTVLLFGPTSPELTGPPAHLRGRHIVLWAGHSGDRNGTHPDPGLLEITVEQVIEAANRQLGSRPASGALSSPDVRRVG
jgi:ADP-heptose:LPS heptosyltransferase